MGCGRPLSLDRRSKTCGEKACAYGYRAKTPPLPVEAGAPEPLPGSPLTRCPACIRRGTECDQCADDAHEASLIRKRREAPPPPVKPPSAPKVHLVIPDCQVAPETPMDHLTHIGRYIADKRPDVIVCIGDFADMKALCSYDKGKKRAEGQRYHLDIEAARQGMRLLTEPFIDLKDYRPRMVMTLGNHEDRISRATEDYSALDMTIRVNDLAYEVFGWEVHPFLEVVEIDGIEYAHYFTSGPMGRPCSSAAAVLRTRQGSAVQGHLQHTDLCFHPKTQKFALLAGTCYQHEEDYLGPQGNAQRRQIVMLHEVVDGRADPMFVSLNFLRKKYGNMPG